MTHAGMNCNPILPELANPPTGNSQMGLKVKRMPVLHQRCAATQYAWRHNTLHPKGLW